MKNFWNFWIFDELIIDSYERLDINSFRLIPPRFLIKKKKEWKDLTEVRNRQVNGSDIYLDVPCLDRPACP